MGRKNLAIALVALAVCAGLSKAQTGDVLRLDIRNGGPTLTPGLDANDGDTQLVRGWYRPHYGYGGFYRPSYYPRYYASYNSFYYARPSYNYGYAYYRPYYGYSNYYYAPPVYYSPSYYSPYYWCPIGDSAPAMPYAASAQPIYTVLRSGDSAPPALLPYPKPYVDNAVPGATYPYDGGPQNPVPMPGAQPQRTVPLEGKAVSLPRSEPKYTYPAYGEGPTSFAQDRVIPVTTPSTQRAAR